MANIQRTDAAAAAHHLSAVKNSAVSPLVASTNGPLPQFGIHSNAGASIYGGWMGAAPAAATTAVIPATAPLFLPTTKSVDLPTPWIY